VRLLVTRPSGDAEALADQLEAMGHQVLAEPMLRIRPIPGASVDLDGVAGLLLTSANGARMLAAITERRDLPVYAVGAQTAAAARDAEFLSVESAEGDAAALVELVHARHRPGDGTLLHAAGAERAGDLAGALAARGYDIRTKILYESVPAATLSEPTRMALAAGLIDGVLLFSPRSAETFAALLHRAGLAMAARRIVAYCLSPAVAKGLGAAVFHAVHIAPSPNRPALLALLPEAG